MYSCNFYGNTRQLVTVHLMLKDDPEREKNTEILFCIADLYYKNVKVQTGT